MDELRTPSALLSEAIRPVVFLLFRDSTPLRSPALAGPRRKETTMTHNPNVYGYVNGKPVFSRDEFIFEHRKRGPIEDDAELIAFAEKATSGWHNAGLEP